MRIELVGGLGVGKTTLANAFERKGAKIVTENIAQNDFLQGCYEGKSDYEFPSQLWFIQTKFKELLDHRNSDKVTVYDQSLLNTRAYVDTYLSDREERAVMHKYMDIIDRRMGKADLYIYLKCSPEEELRRIHNRGRDIEKDVTIEQLKLLSSRLERWLPTVSNLEIINVENMPIEKYEDIADAYTCERQQREIPVVM
jgi:deoxyadenosine/deoxycytidine kinase